MYSFFYLSRMWIFHRFSLHLTVVSGLYTSNKKGEAYTRMLSLFALIVGAPRCEKIISNFSQTESCRHRSSRQVAPTQSALLSRIPDDSYSRVLSRSTTATTITTTTGAVVASITTFVHPPPSTPTTTSFAGSAGYSPCDWFPFSAGWRAVGLPTCRPLPRSHYDADSRGRCTNLSATPLTCVSCLPRQSSVVRWSGSSLSFSLFLSPSLSLLSLSLSPRTISSTVFFTSYPSPYLFPSLSFSLSLSLYCFSFPLSLVYPLRHHLTQQCCVVSCHPAVRQRSSRTEGKDRSGRRYALRLPGPVDRRCIVEWRKWSRGDRRGEGSDSSMERASLWHG